MDIDIFLTVPIYFYIEECILSNNLYFCLFLRWWCNCLLLNFFRKSIEIKYTNYFISKGLIYVSLRFWLLFC